MSIQQIYELYFASGLAWAIGGAMLSVMLGCAGSARGIRVAAAQAAGVLSERPDLFGRLLVLVALPGTQGFYGFIWGIITALRGGLIAAQVGAVTPLIGISLLATGFCIGYVFLRSAIFQGETAAAAINLVAKRPDEAGRAILFPALVETYAVVALLAGVLFVIWLTAPELSFAPPQP